MLGKGNCGQGRKCKCWEMITRVWACDQGLGMWSRDTEFGSCKLEEIEEKQVMHLTGWAAWAAE